jgi:hypothetical protein
MSSVLLGTTFRAEFRFVAIEFVTAIGAEGAFRFFATAFGAEFSGVGTAASGAIPAASCCYWC